MEVENGPKSGCSGWKQEKLITLLHGASLIAARGLERDFHSALLDSLNLVFPRYMK